MRDFDICEDCGGTESRFDLFAPAQPRKPYRDDLYGRLVTMGVVVEPLRCAHCEWDNRLLARSPAWQGLVSLRHLHQEHLIDHMEFLARERAMLQEFLGIDGLETVPGAVAQEVFAHIAALRAGEPDTRGVAGALPDFGSVQRAVTPQQIIAGYDVDTGLVTFAVDLRRVIDLFGADAPGPNTAMWIRLVKMAEAAARTRLVTFDPIDIWDQAFGED